MLLTTEVFGFFVISIWKGDDIHLDYLYKIFKIDFDFVFL